MMFGFRLPEIPEDTPQTNVFMKFDTTVPAFSEIDPNKIQNGLLKLATNVDATVNSIINEFQKGSNFTHRVLTIQMNQRFLSLVYWLCRQKSQSNI